METLSAAIPSPQGPRQRADAGLRGEQPALHTALPIPGITDDGRGNGHVDDFHFAEGGRKRCPLAFTMRKRQAIRAEADLPVFPGKF